MNNYKAVFKLGNGIEGEVKLTANNDGDAFMAGGKMFALFDKVDFHVEKVDSSKILRDKDIDTILEDARKDINGTQIDLNIAMDFKKTEYQRLSDEGKQDEKGRTLNEVIDNLEEATAYLSEARVYLKKAQELMK